MPLVVSIVTMRSPSLATAAHRCPDQLQQQRPLRVQPVLRLVHHHRVRPVEHRVVDLDVAPHRQAVHHDALAAAGGPEPARREPPVAQPRAQRRLLLAACRTASPSPTTSRTPRRRRPCASSGSSMMWTNSPPRCCASRRMSAVSSGSSSYPGGRAMTISMPSGAAASAALAGTAVGSALGCQAQVSTNRLPRGLAQLLPQRHRVGQRLAGVPPRATRS